MVQRAKTNQEVKVNLSRKTHKVRLSVKNLLRRHLTTEQRMLLFAELSRIYEVGRGSASKDQPRSKGKFEPKEAKSASIGKESVLEKIHEEAKCASSLPKESVLEKTTREVGVSPRTIDNARRYAKEIERRGSN